MTSSGLTPLERAFELARTGTHPTVEDIRKQLRAEGFPTDQVFGPSLLRQLRELANAARTAVADG